MTGPIRPDSTKKRVAKAHRVYPAGDVPNPAKYNPQDEILDRLAAAFNDNKASVSEGVPEKLLQSPYADTLRMMTPDFPSVYYEPRDNGNTLGDYQSNANVMRLFPRALQNDPGQPAPATGQQARTQPEWALTHELAHALDRHYDPNNYSIEEAYYHDRTGPDAGPMHMTKNQYGSQSYEEGSAEAFASAMDFLRYTASGPLGTRPEAVLARDAGARASYERLVPGTKAMVQYILKRWPDTFAHHPLVNQLVGAHGAVPDATAAIPRGGSGGKSFDIKE